MQSGANDALLLYGQEPLELLEGAQCCTHKVAGFILVAS